MKLLQPGQTIGAESCVREMLCINSRHVQYLIVVSAVDRAACSLLCQNFWEELVQVARHCRDAAHDSSIVPAKQ